MVDTRRPRSPRPPARLRPAPPLDPPCTDDDPVWSHGQLALDLIDPRRRDLGRPPGRTADTPPGRTHPPASGVSGHVNVAPGGPADGTATAGGAAGGFPVGRLPGGPAVSALATASPEAARAAHRFVRTFLEIVNGFRPPGQIRPLCLPDAAGRVSAALTRAARRVTPVRRRSARPALLLRRLRVCEPRAGAVEATAVFAGAGDASWAIALRLEHRRGNWLCLVLDVL
ncbi:Rv3235 family protein [Micromonospora sp. WMMD980]|uniref:Rv3235 family protein n=1 Tax=Micromonospora sp. WMMD980 TaxID=3016088 RepID=UPI002415B1C9|nr:Rv3235 family protein [Micromonospora sp. WMMD980]MDG4802760.1 Rv3235 family protein [Micromonospora sp. WMMD980]